MSNLLQKLLQVSHTFACIGSEVHTRGGWGGGTAGLQHPPPPNPLKLIFKKNTDFVDMVISKVLCYFPFSWS